MGYRATTSPVLEIRLDVENLPDRYTVRIAPVEPKELPDDLTLRPSRDTTLGEFDRGDFSTVSAGADHVSGDLADQPVSATAKLSTHAATRAFETGTNEKTDRVDQTVVVVRAHIGRSTPRTATERPRAGSRGDTRSFVDRSGSGRAAHPPPSPRVSG